MRLLLTTLLVLSALRQADAQVCAGLFSPSPDEGPYSSYTVPNLIAHNIERINHDQRDVSEIHLVNPRIFGLDAENAILTASLHAINGGAFDIPQIYSFALRTDNCGKTWVQTFDPIDRRIPTITDVRFIGKRGLLLYELSRAGYLFGFFYSQNWGETWINSEITGANGPAFLVDWSVRKPHEGVAVLKASVELPLQGDDYSRLIGYWVLRTQNGFRWTVEKVIERQPGADAAASSYLFPPEWDPTSDLWQIREADDVLSVVNNGIVVLQVRMNRVWPADPSDR